MFPSALLLWATIPLGLAGLAALLLRPAGGEPGGLPSPVWALVALLPAAAFAAMRGSAQFLLGGDEYARPAAAMAWAASPFFAPHDHVWLGGHFYAMGLLYRLAGSLVVANAVLSCAGFAALVAAAWWTAGKVWGAGPEQAVAAALAGCAPVVLWMSVNPWAEALAYPPLLAAYGCWAAFRAEQEAPDGDWRRERWLAFGAALLAFGTTLRYEAWIAGLLLGPYLLWRGGWLARRGERRGAALLLASATLLAAYPLAWVVSSKLALGSFTAFAENSRRINFEQNYFYDYSTALSRLLVFPTTFAKDHGYLLPLAFAGAVAALRSGARGPRAFLYAFIAVFLFATLSTMRSGLGSSVRPRMTMAAMLPAAVLAAGGLAAAARLLPERLRPVALAAVLAAGAFAQARWAVVRYDHGWGQSADLLALASRIARERDPSRLGRGEALVHPWEMRLHVYDAGDPLPHWVLSYFSPEPALVEPHYSKEGLLASLASEPPGARALVRAAEFPDGLPGSRRVLGMGAYDVWERNAQ
ncbi:MAG: hypothetical protein SF028_07035 [Candidatus Sumerlaeia bacterium]|nr:hypothetical protein [Candidatus Sumerlaeia bacterium]